MIPSAALVRGIRYHNADWPGLGLEVVAMGDFWLRASEQHFRRPRRPDFHHLLLCTAGEGYHSVDFQRLPLFPGGVVHVRPGQVHAFGWSRDMGGVILMFAPEALLPEPPGIAVGLPPCLQVEEPDRTWVEAAFRDLLAEYGRTDGGPVSARLMRHLLSALILRLGRLASRVEGPLTHGHTALFRAFEEEVERRFRHTRAVADYARRLGYATRTLARAAREAGAPGPKALIDARVLLEAKRLLAYTDLSIGRVAVHLGFSEPTNFTKFFCRQAGMSPEAFRRKEGLGPSAAGDSRWS